MIKLGYLVFESNKTAKWKAFCEDMFGLPAIENVDGSVGHHIDGVQRLVVTAGDAEDVGAIGLELDDEAELARLAARVSAEEPEPLRAARRVRKLVAFRDPAGNRIEAFVGPEIGERLRSPVFPGGFHAADQGIGHAALVARDLEAMERFYVDVLGFGVTERMSSKVGPIDIRGVFLHCNRRHHSLAIFDLPSRKRMHHFMLEVNAMNDVGRAFERARKLGVPLSLGLGQHSSPDGTFSFYGGTPSGFEFEIGAGAGEIEFPLAHELVPVKATAWGHEPTMRLKLKTFGAIVANRFA